jgi:hypothetical protein
LIARFLLTETPEQRQLIKALLPLFITRTFSLLTILHLAGDDSSPALISIWLQIGLVSTSCPDARIISQRERKEGLA